jgi:hypothetical protein
VHGWGFICKNASLGGQLCRRRWSHVIFQNWNSCECLTPEPAESIYRVLQTPAAMVSGRRGWLEICTEPLCSLSGTLDWPPTSSTFLRSSSIPLPAFFGPTLLPTPKDIQRHSLNVRGSNSTVRYTFVSRKFIRRRSVSGSDTYRRSLCSRARLPPRHVLRREFLLRGLHDSAQCPLL